jgi:SAM-dependent methyltransferase
MLRVLKSEGTSRGDPELAVCGVDLRALAEISSETLREHGVGPAGAGWASAASQELRFAVLVEAAQLRAGDAVTVNDLGCGYGSLYDHLVRRGIGVTEYNGYDISDEMLAAARAHVRAEHAHFWWSAEVIRTADFSFLSGPLNLKVAHDETWKVYARAIVKNLARHSRHGFAFNMMTTKVTYRVDELYYANPAEWLDWCRRKISPNLTLIEDYPLYEWTIGGRTENPA